LIVDFGFFLHFFVSFMNVQNLGPGPKGIEFTYSFSSFAGRLPQTPLRSLGTLPPATSVTHACITRMYHTRIAQIS
jgi:hypothetical protein